jgi:translation initiation factor IF-2
LIKVRVYDLAKRYGMKGPELADLLKRMGFDKIKSHMAVLDDANQMLVIARLEAQGLTPVAESAAGEKEAPAPRSAPRKKAPDKPTKKSLPPAVEKPTLRKKLPHPHTDTGATVPEPEPEPEPVELELEPETAPAARPAAVEPVRAAPPPPPPTPAPEPEPEPEPVQAAPAPAAEPEPAAAVGKAEPDAGPSPAADDSGEPGEGDDADKAVRPLLVPKAKAQVVGRIDLSQEVIRDATRRSAPPGERTAADRRLRRMALQSTQSRTAARTGPGQRRGPGAGRGRDSSHRQRKSRTKDLSIATTVDPDKVIEIQPPISLKSLSEALGIKVQNLIATLTFKLGVKGKTINSFLNPDEVELVALEVGRNIKLVERKEAEDELIQDLVSAAADESEMTRPPVLTFMGHVDHGKTTLLDALRDSDVTKGEAGGITQHIGAYKIHDARGCTYVVLDTPGHAAFTQMRARGAKLTDIVVLVVAADDGVMPQTEEAINHAKEAKVPIVVAINKCDRHNANAMQVRQQLAVKGLQPEEWGGSTQMVEVSATTKKGLDDLIDKVMLEAELLELSARPSAPGQGTVIESKQTPEQGVVVNVLVTDGTMRIKDQVLVGESLSRIRSMVDDHGNQLDEAGPATPVTILGIDQLPNPGDKLFVVADTKKAKEVAEERQRRARDISLAERSTVTLENLSEALAAQKVGEIKIVLKADVMGSLEPIRRSLEELNTAEVRINIIHSALGGITENDVTFAQASGAIVIGFNSVPDQAARQAAERGGVDIRFYDVIYTLVDDMRAALEGLLAPEELERTTGQAEIRAIFKSSKFGKIAGCYVTDGTINRGGRVRLSRDGKVVYTGKCASLRREKDDVREVKAGFECGLTLHNYDDIKEGDRLDFFDVEFVKRTL